MNFTHPAQNIYGSDKKLSSGKKVHYNLITSVTKFKNEDAYEISLTLGGKCVLLSTCQVIF